MAVTITLKTLQQQTFKIRMEPDETVGAGPEPGGGNDGCRGWVGAGRTGSRLKGRGGRRGQGPAHPSLLAWLPSLLLVFGPAPSDSC